MIKNKLNQFEADWAAMPQVKKEELAKLTCPEERELIRFLSTLGDTIIGAAKNYDPAKVTHYAVDLATLFHKFYSACRVGVEDESLMQARLFLCICVKDTMKSILNMLKVDAPERM